MKSKRTKNVVKRKKNVVKRKEKTMSVRENELAKLTIRELKELRIKVDQTIASRQIDERNGLKEKFREMAEAAGFNLNEIVSGKAGKGRPVAAKFANPANPHETWSGRGRQPRWLSAKLKSGSKLEDFKL